jgi:non-specific serine/threonine protein kinase/serine/threonine-protein kinase
MIEKRMDRVGEILEQAISMEPAQRLTYVNEACAGDAELRREVESLLGSFDLAGSQFLNPEAGGTTASPGRRSVLPGRRIGAYDILEEIGRGGMGEVFAAARADGQYQKKVAIKLVRGGYHTEFIWQRFRNERQILAGLDHPNIARLVDGGTTDDDVPYLVMELVEGAPIDRYCDAQKLSISERLRLFRQVCSAVQYAHQHLVIHRDLKPGNILVTKQGDPKLLDFGIARILDDSGTAEATQLRPFTPEYASPEQVRGERVTTATDVYSLGVVLYRLLTGRSPYRLSTGAPAKLAEVITHQEPERPSASVCRTEAVLDDGKAQELTAEAVSAMREGSPLRLQRRLRGDLDYILLKALRKEPDKRYGSVEQFSEDIRRHLEGLPVAARIGTWSYRARKFVRRHRTSVGAAALAVVTLVAGVVLTWREARIAESNRRIAETQRQRAEARFNDVRKLANSLMFEIHDSIAVLPGSTPARKLIVQQSLEYLDDLSQESGGDVSLQRELAAAYDRVGTVQGNAFQSHLGDPTGALASFRKAMAIRQAIAATHPTAPNDMIALARTHRLIGQIQWLSLANTAAALDSFQRAASIAETAVRNGPSSVDALRELARDYEKLGNIQSGQGPRGGVGDIRASLEYYRQALALRRAIMSFDPNDPTAQRELAKTTSEIGDELVKLGEREQGLDSYRQAIEILNLLAKGSKDTILRRSLAIEYSRMGDALMKDAKPAEAIRHFRKQFNVIEPMAAADPKDVDMQTRLICARANIGNALVHADRPREGLRMLKRSLSEAEHLATSGSDALNRMILASFEVWVGEALENSGDAQGALHYYSRAFLRYSAIIAQDPQDLHDKVNLVAVGVHLTRVQIKQDSIKEAARQSNETLTLAESLVSTNPENMDVLYALADSYAAAGEVAALKARQAPSVKDSHRYWNHTHDFCQKSLTAWRKIPKPSKIAPNGFEVTDPEEVTRMLAQANAELARP